MRLRLALVVLATGLPLSGCAKMPAGMPGSAASANAANPYPQPPPIPPETRPQPPISENALMWEPGHWDWNGASYVWNHGQWIDRTGHGTSWQDGYWTNAGGAWTWIPAHWL